MADLLAEHAPARFGYQTAIYIEQFLSVNERTGLYRGRG